MAKTDAKTSSTLEEAAASTSMPSEEWCAYMLDPPVLTDSFHLLSLLP